MPATPHLSAPIPPQPHPPGTVRAGGHGHDVHGHDVHGHQHHKHDHAPENLARERKASRFSLIAMSGLARLALVAPVLGLLWLLTFWVIANG